MSADVERGPIRILHLEDNPRDADIINHKLEVGGVHCDIVVANSRGAFDAALERDAFDLVLCDYNVPGYDGLSALKRVKAVRPEAPVIIISGSVGEDEAVNCLQTGATDYLLKERLERLAPAVRRAIREADERQSRARAEEALQERERRLSVIYDAVADILFYIQVDGDGAYRIMSVNPAFLAASGLTYEQVVGRRVEEVFPTPSLATEHFGLAIREKRIERWEETAELPNGRRTGAISVTPVFDSAGRCTHLVGAIHDMTERRDLEAQLRQAQKMESVGQLAGGIAHDFNNLLTVINGVTELALERVKDADTGLRDDLQEIRRAGERAAALTRQLLAFSRKQILKPQTLDLNTVVTDISNMLRRLLGEDVVLKIASPATEATVKADRGQIEQVIANLAVNARDAMPDGGMLTIETRSVSLDQPFIEKEAVAASPGPYVALSVRDTGTGMDDATRRRVFEPFFTTKAPGKGTGLGLSTVYGIVRQSGGFIQVQSTLGRGTCFTAYLPQVAHASAAPPTASGAAAARGTETILVVEDVAALRRLIGRTLQAAGYTVVSAGGGEEALKKLDEYGAPVHLVVTDVVMPGMSGRDLAERLAQLRPGMKVLYMSGYTDDVVMRHRVFEEKVPFISKPFAVADLLRTIRETLEGPRSPSS